MCSVAKGGFGALIAFEDNINQVRLGIAGFRELYFVLGPFSRHSSRRFAWIGLRVKRDCCSHSLLKRYDLERLSVASKDHDKESFTVSQNQTIFDSISNVIPQNPSAVITPPIFIKVCPFLYISPFSLSTALFTPLLPHPLHLNGSP